MISISASVTSLAISLMLVSCGSTPAEQSEIKEYWNQENAPENMGVDLRVTYDQLPQRARLTGDAAPWSGDYWATYQGGIAQRWQNGPQGNNYQRYLYQPLTTNQATQLSNSQLNRLSPAEKLDLYMGKSDFPLTRSELNRVQKTAANNGGNIPGWFGLCHGWAAAAYMEAEPMSEVSVPLRGGQELTFQPSDLKALITHAYANANVEAEMIGTRCEGNTRRFPIFGGRWSQPNCRDTNAGAFHLTITEYIGRRGESFVAEMDRDKEVWNHPVIGYAFEYGRARRIGRLGRRFNRMHPDAAYTIPVNMALDYVVETAAGATPGEPAIKQRNLRYNIEVTRDGHIVGGEWKSRNQPDFLWRLTREPRGNRAGVPVEMIRELIKEAN